MVNKLSLNLYWFERVEIRNVPSTHILEKLFLKIIKFAHFVFIVVVSFPLYLVLAPFEYL